MKRILLYSLLGLLTFTNQSCKKESDEPANVITDEGGLKVFLNWTNNDGSDPTTTNNLDLYVFLEDTFGSPWSSTTNGFEGVTIHTTSADLDVRLEVYFTKVMKNGNFKISVEGVNSGKKYEVSQAFTSSFEGSGKDIIRIIKAGNSYTLTNL